MSLSLLPAAASTITSAHPSPSGALLTASLAATAGSPYLALALARAGDDTAPNAGQSLPPLHLTPDDLTALRTALDMVARAHAAMGDTDSVCSPVVPRHSQKKKAPENDKARQDISPCRAFSYTVGTAGFEPATP